MEILVLMLFAGITSLIVNLIDLFKPKNTNQEVGKEDISSDINPKNLKPKKPKFSFRSFFVLLIISFLLIFLLIFGLSFDGATKNEDPLDGKIINSVESMKSQIVFPYEVDENTTMVNITPEEKAIRYHYEIKEIPKETLEDPEFLSIIKDKLLEQVCVNVKTRELLNNVNLQYSYLLKETSETFLITLNKSDCSN